jgi:hypothetical protein
MGEVWRDSDIRLAHQPHAAMREQGDSPVREVRRHEKREAVMTRDQIANALPDDTLRDIHKAYAAGFGLPYMRESIVSALLPILLLIPEGMSRASYLADVVSRRVSWESHKAINRMSESVAWAGIEIDEFEPTCIRCAKVGCGFVLPFGCIFHAPVPASTEGERS